MGLSKKSIVTVILSSILIFFNAAHAIPTPRLELSTKPIYSGDTFTLEVFIDGVTEFEGLSGPELDGVLAFGFDPFFNTSEFDFVGAVVNPLLFEDDSNSPITPVVAGQVNLFENIPPFGDNILLASLSFTSLIEGYFNIGIVSDLSNPNAGLIAWSGFYDIGASTPVTVSPVPEPATVILLISGMAGLGVFGRKKFRKK